MKMLKTLHADRVRWNNFVQFCNFLGWASLIGVVLFRGCEAFLEDDYPGLGIYETGFSADSRVLVGSGAAFRPSGSSKNIIAWDTGTGKQRWNVAIADVNQAQVTISADARSVITLTEAKRPWLPRSENGETKDICLESRDIFSGEVTRYSPSIKRDTNFSVQNLDAAPAGNAVVAAFSDSLTIWEKVSPLTGEYGLPRQITIPHAAGESVYEAQFTHDSRKLLVSLMSAGPKETDFTTRVELWDAATGKRLRSFGPRLTSHGIGQILADLSPDRRRVAMINPALSALILYDVDSGAILQKAYCSKLYKDSHCDFSGFRLPLSPTTAAQVSTRPAGWVYFDIDALGSSGPFEWNLATNTLRKLASEENSPRFVDSYSPDGRFAAIGDGYHHKPLARIFDRPTGRETVRLESP